MELLRLPAGTTGPLLAAEWKATWATQRWTEKNRAPFNESFDFERSRGQCLKNRRAEFIPLEFPGKIRKQDIFRGKEVDLHPAIRTG